MADKDKQFIAPRLTLFEEDWVFFLSPGAFRALMYLLARAKFESSQKDPGKCPRISAAKAAYDWRVTTEEVEEMEAAAIKAEFLVVVGDSWKVVDSRIFQSERTTQRQTTWEAENAPTNAPAEDRLSDLAAGNEDLESLADKDDVCPTNTPIVGQTLSMRVESSENSIATTLGNPIVPPEGGKKGFSRVKFLAWFENEFKPAYPRRRGGYEWPVAASRLEAAFRAKTARPDCVLEALGRYRVSMEREGKIGTELVKQASTWVTKKGWLDDYDEGDGGASLARSQTPRTPRPGLNDRMAQLDAEFEATTQPEDVQDADFRDLS